MLTTISFPGLFEKPITVDPIAFSIGNFGLRWYGVIIALGFLLAIIYVFKRASEFNTNTDQFVDILLWALPAAIIGARLYYVFNSWADYKDDLSQIFKIWEGGLAIYGGIIAAFVTAFIVCKVRKFDILSIFDLGAMGFLIGQCIGRWGNFINAEAFGTATTLPWRMIINRGAAVHPTFLYESLWNLIGFILLHFYSKRRKFRGELFLMYIAWYGLGRSFIEGLRTVSLYLGNTDIRISQLLAIISCIAAVAIWLMIVVGKMYTPVNEAYARMAAEKAEPAAEASDEQEVSPEEETETSEEEAPPTEENNE